MLLGGLVPAARTAARAEGAQPVVDVIEVAGLVDGVVADFMTKAIGDSERSGHEALVVQLDSGGSVVGRRRFDTLVARIRNAAVPVAVWVGPSGARAEGDAARLVAAAGVAGRAPGTTLSARARAAVAASDVSAPTLGDFIVGLDGHTVGGRTLATARQVQRGTQPRREPAVRVRFEKLSLLGRLLHTASSPAVAYLLLLIGLLLVAFEFFSAGIGVAGAVGAGCLLLAGFGLGALPVRPWAVALLVLGVLGFCVDVQAGAPQAWTVIGAAATVVGTFGLYHHLSLRWPAVVLGIAGVAVFMLGAMPAMLRSRFGTPTIGRDSMIGSRGTALGALNPEGTVRVGGAEWRARTNRATPIEKGAPVRVVAIDGVLLEVEPEDESRRARDYRAPRSSH